MTMANAKVWLLLLLRLALVSMGRGDCPLPQLTSSVLLSERSILQNNFPNNSEAFLECPNGFQIESGSTSIFCRDREWSAVELKCKKIDCGEPKPSPHMTYILTDGTLFGAYTKPVCERGYYLEGLSYRQCLVRGWSGKSKCSLMTCLKPAEIAHGKIVTQLEKEDIVVDDIIEYSCNASYALHGNRFITCNEDGNYNLPPPTCKSTECQVPEVKSGIQTEGNPPYSNKSEARFKCERGYTMKGSDTAVCVEGEWSPIPECVQEKSNAADTTTKQTTAGVTTNTKTPTTNTILNEKKEEHLSVYSLIVVIVVGCLCLTVFVIILMFVVLICCHKQRGSYNTGEGQWRKEEELLPFQKPRANNRTVPLA
ncbi:complement factor H [Triplophysa dalaica]|uniref:complement factor H n=1 Tax=Triplophysa dalaica TaxID=1582913 RepID=UPI0024E005D9|nr:complement factor H [Triplophysa dalaica]